ncbi:hypothetical protein QBC35DRAFT_45238 [Podospora australis]|uniref:Mid2 domain-containing protein n=1 Tax=Podospora australis TaxID=1536484 RepID=A0AAN7AJG9_9PEZI|nr:hypothetical protein QBC35DRAFT_45238 [Podospora australis]
MRTSTPQIRAFALISATSLWAAAGVLADPNAPCYWPSTEPDGEFALGYFPCHAFGKEVSSCCAPGWTCFSNSLCMATTPSRSWPNITIGAVQRGACTAPKWDNNACGSICLTGDNYDGKLAYCGNNRYCCMGDFETGKCTCEEGGGNFEQDGEAIAQTIIQVTDTTFTGRPSPTTAAPPASFRSTESESATTSTSTTLSTLVTSGSSSSTDPTSSPTSTAEPASDGGEEEDKSRKKKLVISLAVAIPVGVIAIAFLAAWLITKRRRDKASKIGAAPEPEHSAVGNEPSYDMGLAENHQNGVNFGQHYYQQK